MYSERGHFTLGAHRCRDPHRALARRGEQASRRRFRADLSGRHPAALSDSSTCPTTSRYPILGALYHPPGAIARHDAVAWGYAARRRCARRRDPYRHRGHRDPQARATARSGSRPTRGTSMPARSCRPSPAPSRVSRRWPGFGLPIRTIPLQACVSVAAQAVPRPDRRLRLPARLHLASSRGELVMGGVDRSLSALFHPLDARFQGRADGATCSSCSPSSAK